MHDENHGEHGYFLVCWISGQAAVAPRGTLILASIFTVASSIGYPLIFLIVMIETGCGIPIAPGEIAVVTGGIAASDGKLNIVAVIAVSSVAAIIGDNIGYVVGRKGGRWVLERPGPFVKQRHNALGLADWFFDRHGPKAVFIGRWLPILRVYASWLAGGARMPWRTFAAWNAAGGIAWALSIGLFGYFVGNAATTVMQKVGIIGIPIVLIGIVGVTMMIRRQIHRIAEETPRGTSIVADSLVMNAIVQPTAVTSTSVEPPSL
jgi:membrane protein DedA with SNARE-associated domain